MVMEGLNYPTKDELSYFTTERNTGSKWIDGSAIYKKTVELGALPNATSKSVSHSISGIKTIVKIEGFATASGRSLPLPHVSTDISTCIQIDANRTAVTVNTVSHDRSSFTGYATIYYTKFVNPIIEVTTAGVAGSTNAVATITFNDYGTLTQIKATNTGGGSSVVSIYPGDNSTLSDNTLTVKTSKSAASYWRNFVATFTSADSVTTTLTFDPFTAGTYGGNN